MAASIASVISSTGRSTSQSVSRRSSSTDRQTRARSPASSSFCSNLLSTPTASLLPEPPPLLDDDKTGLREIANYLATPPWSGLYLSRADLGRLGRAERLPRGFGPRARMLANLLRSAATFDRLDPLLNQLAGMIQTWRSHYAALAEREVPILEMVAQTWLERLDATEEIITRMRAATMTDVDFRF